MFNKCEFNTQKFNALTRLWMGESLELSSKINMVLTIESDIT
jgi:hypothetical protein